MLTLANCHFIYCLPICDCYIQIWTSLKLFRASTDESTLLEETSFFSSSPLPKKGKKNIGKFPSSWTRSSWLYCEICGVFVATNYIWYMKYRKSHSRKKIMRRVYQDSPISIDIIRILYKKNNKERRHRPKMSDFFILSIIKSPNTCGFCIDQIFSQLNE